MVIAIYSRKSKFTGKGDSIANQIELCQQEAARYLTQSNLDSQSCEILVYEDEGFSGKNTARPQFQEMMRAIHADKISCVICYKLDRISRNVGDFALTYEEFQKHDVSFICVNEKYDTTTPSGRAMMSMVSVFAQLERETTAERIRDNMYMLARTGRWLGGHCPTGFASEKEERTEVAGKTRTSFKLVPVPDDLDLVRFIFDKFIELQSVAGTTHDLVQKSIKTRGGSEFTSLAVKDILRNPVYCVAGEEADAYFREHGADICYEEGELDNKRGFMPYNRTSSNKTRQVKNAVSEWMIAVGQHDGVVPAGVWVKIQRLLDARREKSKAIVRTPYKSEALLSGLLVCGNCNHPMRPHVHTSRKTADGSVPYYYICELKERSSKKRCDMSNANGAIIDQVVIDALTGFELTGSPIKKSLQGLRERLAGRKGSEQKQQGLLETKLRDNEKQIENLIAALGVGNDSDAFTDRVRARVNSLEEDCALLRMEIAKAAFNNTAYNDYESQLNAVFEALRKLRDTVLTASVVEKRELLKATVERVEWDGKQAHIFLLGEQKR